MRRNYKVPPDGELFTKELSWYRTGFDQELVVHNKEDCAGRHCVIHNPSDHSMREFPTYFRYDKYLMERICPHGIGHPDPDDLAWHISQGRSYQGEHGCDGCCHTDEDDDTGSPIPPSLKVVS